MRKGIPQEEQAERGKRLRAYLSIHRKRLRMPFGEMAHHIGLTKQASSEWFRTGSIGRDTLRKLAALIKRPVHEIEAVIDGHVTLTPLHPEGALDLPAKTGFLVIPQLNVGGSMGTGRYAPDHVEVVHRLVVDPVQLQRKVGYTAKGNLNFITGYGDSMEPTFSDGDVLLIDAGIFEVKIDAVYVLERGDEIFIKRLQRRPDGSLLMISDNKKYEPFTIEREKLAEYRVRGRVILAWNAMRL